MRVYDLTVDGEPEFFAGGILVHNCAAMTYLVRRVELSTNARPHPPAHTMVSFPAGATVIDRLPWQPKSESEKALEEAQNVAHGIGQRGRLKMFHGGRR